MKLGRICRAVPAALVAALAGILLTGCTSSGAPPEPPTRPVPSPIAAPTVVGRPDCRPPSVVNRGSGVPEVHGAGDGIQMWGLVMAATPFALLHVHEDVKIVWRVTGQGPLHLSSIDPAGRTHRLQWGPDPHLSSNYDRPGQEWGAGYRFGEPGCWTLRAVRGHASAEAWVRILG